MAALKFEYGWENVTVVFFGKIIEGIEALTYETSKESVLIYGRGSKPVAQGSSTKENTGEMRLHQSEVEALHTQLTGSQEDLTDLEPFDITITYTSPDLTSTTVHELKDVKITSYGQGGETGASHMASTLSLTIGSTKRRVA